MFTKKMTALKAKLSDTTIPPIEPTNTANVKDKRKKYKFRRTISDSNTMAELLVRSVIHVHSSLECITEAPDLPPPVLKKQKSLSEYTTSEIPKKFKSSLSLPEVNADALSSNPSDASESSSSDEDESEPKEKTIEYDTVSAIVKNVRRLSMIQNNSGAAMETMSIQSMDVLTEQGETDSISGYSVMNTPIEDRGEWQFDTISTNGNAERKSGDEDRISYNCQITTIAEHEENEEIESSVKDLSVSEENSQQTELEDNPESIQWRFEDIPSDWADKKVLFSLEDSAETSQIPPKAEFDDFNLSDEEAAGLPIEDDKNERKVIIPPVMMGANIGNKGLMKTAMEMLLLDKVNLMSTYTPPTSPTLESKKKFEIPASRSLSIDQQKDQSFLPKITETFQTIRRSSTQSLNYQKRNDGAHRSLLSLQDLDHTQGVKKREFRSITNSPNENEYKRGFASLDNRKHHCLLSITENKLKNIFQTPLQLFRGDSKKKVVEDKSGQQGLLGTALENVLMDSVNEILATSSGNGGTTKSEHPINPQTSCELTSNTTSQLSKPNVPANTEIAKGNAINQTHASFEPFTRTVGSPQLEYARQEHGHQRTESMGAKFSQSPAKLHGFTGIHRRSSDSDLSITPKGK